MMCVCGNRIIQIKINNTAFLFLSLVPAYQQGVTLIGAIGNIGLLESAISPLAPSAKAGTVLTNLSLVNLLPSCPLGLNVSTAPTSTKRRGEGSVDDSSHLTGKLTFI